MYGLRRKMGILSGKDWTCSKFAYAVPRGGVLRASAWGERDAEWVALLIWSGRCVASLEVSEILGSAARPRRWTGSTRSLRDAASAFCWWRPEAQTGEGSTGTEERVSDVEGKEVSAEDVERGMEGEAVGGDSGTGVIRCMSEGTVRHVLTELLVKSMASERAASAMTLEGYMCLQSLFIEVRDFKRAQKRVQPSSQREGFSETSLFLRVCVCVLVCWWCF